MPERKNREVYQKLNKNLAKLGDSIINFITSAALTFFYKKPQGVRVKNSILRFAWINVHDKKGVRKPVLMPEDLAEAYIAYLWLIRRLTIDEMIEILVKSLITINPKSEKSLEEAIKRGIEKILRVSEKL